jgi:hypothetical protein
MQANDLRLHNAQFPHSIWFQSFPGGFDADKGGTHRKNRTHPANLDGAASRMPVVKQSLLYWATGQKMGLI